jgi:WD40 repeat protein
MSGSAEAPPVEIAIELTKSPHADSQSKRGGGGDRLLTEVRGGLENADCCLMPGKGGDDLLKARIRKFMHTRPVNSVCFSPDGKKVATGSSDGFTRVFDVNSGKEIMKTIGLGVHVSSVCFSPDCKWVATGSWDGFARVFDVASSEEIMRTIKHGLWVESVCFSSDGKRIATGSWDKFARVFNVSSGVSSGEDILKTTEHGGKVTSVRFSHDGNSIATGCEDGFVRIFDVGSGKEIPKFLKAIKHGDAGVNSVCFSHDSKSVATGSSDGVARVFDVGSGQEILKAIKHGGNVTSVCVSPDGRRVVTGSEDKLARVFDVGSGKEILQSIQHGGKVTSVCFSPDGESVTTGSEDGFARIYDVGSEEAVLKAIAHGGKVTSICFSPDGKWVATGSEDKFARVFDVGSGKEVFKTIEHGGKVESVSFSYDGNRIATGGWDKLLRFFDVVSGEEMLKAIKHGGRVTSVCFSPDGSRVVTGSSDGFARVFDVGSGEEMLKTAKHGGHVVSVCFSPDGKSVATGSEDGFARVFDVKSGKEILKTIEHGIHVSSVCFSPDSKWVATGSSDSYARVFDVSSGNEIMRTIEHGGEILTVCYSSDGKSIVTGSLDGFARVFVIANRKQQKMQALKPCMIFPATNIAISSIHSIAVANDCNFQLLPRPMNFSSDFWLPVSPSIVLLWSCLSEDLQRQCFCSDSQVIVSEFWASEGGGLFALASKWQDLNFPRVLPTLKRLFDGEEPVVNAGLILRELLPVAGSKVLPNAEVVQALIRNVSRHASFAVHDSLLTEQLTRAACIPSIQSIVDEFWTSLVELVPSCPVVVHNVNHVSFSETSRMYVAGSESTSEQVFENHFKMRPQSKGSHLNFEHFLVPYPNASAHRDGSNAGSADATGVSLMQALVETNNIDVFGTVTVRAIVQHKWETFGFSLWIREFCIYSLGLAFLVALGILDWQNWELPPNDRDNAPPAIISVLFGVVIIRSFYRKMKEFLYSIPDGEGSLLKRILKSDQHKDFWSWLDLLHITLGMSVVALVWAQSPKALPVVAITSFLRWWGTLFFLQVNLFACVDMFMLQRTLTFDAGVRQIWLVRPHAGRNCEGDSLVHAHYAHQHSGNLELVHSASQAPMSRARCRF